MVQSRRPNVLELRSRNADRAEERARDAVLRLVAECDDALAAVTDGDVDSIFVAHRAINRAMGIVLENRLATVWPNFPTCRKCGAERSYGRCWGCGSPPERAS